MTLADSLSFLQMITTVGDMQDALILNAPLLHYLDLFGTVVFAITGVLAAAEKRLDLFGVIMVGMVTAIGGGTLRDLLLGRLPVFWVQQAIYIWIILATTLLTFIAARFYRFPHRFLLVADALGLAVFAVIGARIALELGHAPVIVVIMGVMSGVFGGVLRDVLTNEVPLIFQRDIYATAALVGAAVFVILHQFLPPEANPLKTIVAVLVTLLIRLAAIVWHFRLPIFLMLEKGKNNL